MKIFTNNLALLILSSVLLSGPGMAQMPGMSTEVSVYERADSAKHAISRRAESPSDREMKKSCWKTQRAFMDSVRKADPAFGEVEKGLNQAKLAHESMSDSSVSALVQRKGNLELNLDALWRKTKSGKTCVIRDAAWNKKLESALKADRGYQKLLKKMADLEREGLDS